MKKVALILAFLMVIPGAAFGLEMMNDSALDGVTGQAGVSIIADDIQIFLNIERMAWLDCDGFDTGDAAAFYGDGECEGFGGAVGISNFQLDVLEINAISNSGGSTNSGQGTGGFAWTTNLGSVNCGSLDLNWDYGDTTTGDACTIDEDYDLTTTLGTQSLGLNNYDQAANNGSGAILYRPIEIDASSQMPAATEGFTNNKGTTVNIGGVMIGLPTLEVYIPTLSFTPAFYNLDSGTAATDAVNDVDGTPALAALSEGANYGTVEMTGITFTVLSGWLEIAPH